MSSTRRNVIKALASTIGVSSSVGMVSGKSIRQLRRNTSPEDKHTSVWTYSSVYDQRRQIGPTSPDGNDEVYGTVGSAVTYLGSWLKNNSDIVQHDFLLDNSFAGVYIENSSDGGEDGIPTPPDNSSDVVREGISEHAAAAQTTDGLSESWLIPNVAGEDNYAGATHGSNGGFEANPIQSALVETVKQATGLVSRRVGYGLAASAIISSLSNDKSTTNEDEPTTIGYGWSTPAEPSAPANHLRVQWRVPSYASASLKFTGFCKATRSDMPVRNEIHITNEGACDTDVSSLSSSMMASTSSGDNLITPTPGGGGTDKPTYICTDTPDGDGDVIWANLDLPEGGTPIGAFKGSSLSSSAIPSNGDPVIKYHDPRVKIE